MLTPHPSLRTARRDARTLALALTVVVGCLGGLGAALPSWAQAPPPAGSGVVYQPPVAAPVVDGFRAPATPFGPGNRGIDYATAPGTPIGAIADGVVVFAGPVAGSLHVTVLHAD